MNEEKRRHDASRPVNLRGRRITLSQLLGPGTAGSLLPRRSTGRGRLLPHLVLGLTCVSLILLAVGVAYLLRPVQTGTDGPPQPVAAAPRSAAPNPVPPPPSLAPEPAPGPAAAPDPAVTPTPEPIAAPAPDPAPDPAPEPTHEPAAAPEPTHEPARDPAPEPARDPAPEPTRDPAAARSPRTPSWAGGTPSTSPDRLPLPSPVAERSRMIEPGTPAPSPLAATSARSGQSVRNGEGRDAYDSPEPLGRHPADHDSDARDPEPHHATRSGQHDSNHDDSDHNSDDGKSDDGNSDDGDQVCEDQDQSDYDCRFSDTIGRVGNALEELLRRGLLYDAGVRNPALTWLLPRRTGP